MEGFLFLEESYKKKSFIGVDEVGRGPLAGPVVACSVFYQAGPKNFYKDIEILKELGVTDSKKLSLKKRMTILKELKMSALKCGNEITASDLLKGRLKAYLYQCSEKKIDQINILQASLFAMKKSIDFHGNLEASILVDGNKLPQGVKGEAIIKGDSKCFTIGLASIIAKVYRDNLMAKFDKAYPHYNFAKNAGYPTKAHKDALKKFGVTKIHRKTFKGVKELL